MAKLESIVAGMSLVGIEPAGVVSVVAVVAIAEGAVQVIYRTAEGAMKEALLNRADEARVSVSALERPWSFEGDGEKFKLATEAKRIDLAFLFDPMMAVHTSNVDPLPHQITAVYESMLPRTPLRFVLADDPGAGKTIMAGLYIRELIMRADARRILVVAPGSLVEQWRDELHEKFGLEFHVYSRELEAAVPGADPLSNSHQLIVRLDQMALNEEAQQKLCSYPWDLIVFDEAHKLSAHFYGTKIEKTKRFKLAEKMGQHTRHLLLMTATPHNGKEEDYQLFLSLLDSDRFYGKFRDGVHKVDASDLMRRMVKEEMLRFDGTPLFPERKAYTVNYKLSDIELRLYEAVTRYVQTEMGKADQLDGRRKGSVGFALTALQRRLASSPEAIFQSLKRRRERLERRLREEKLGIRAQQAGAETVPDVPEDDDDLSADEQESLEETLVYQATAALSVNELQAEIIILQDLENQAKGLVASGQDRKWDELSHILRDDERMRGADNRLRKLIIFSEHRDTLNYLYQKIVGVLGKSEAVVTIHGGTHRDERRKLQAQFRSDPDVRVLIATDAASEGVNLQNANLMVNYDLPWNPNRLEQRFGRIHRIGQQAICHLWNLVAKETREGDVYHKLLMKLEVEGAALNGRVFDILGEVFDETPLRDLLMDAIRYGDQPEVLARLNKKVDNVLDQDRLREILKRNALAQETMSADRLFAVKEEMEKAEARRLQPYFVRSFFLKAFEAQGGTINQREGGRFEITHVPALIRERDRRITGRNRRELEPVLRRYDRVCFTRDAVRPVDKPGVSPAVMLHPGHPLMLSLSDMILEQNGGVLRQGTVFVDPTDDGDQPHLLFILTHEIKSGDDLVLSKRLQFVRVAPDGTASFAGWAPHLDLEPLASGEKKLLKDVMQAPWISGDLEQRALARAAATLVPDHYNEVAGRRIAHVDKTLAAVHERLTKEIAFWSDRWIKLKEDKDAGKDVRLNLENARRTVSDLEGRLENRKKELMAMRHVVSATPVAMGGALVVPAGLMRRLRGETDAVPVFAADAAARSRIEHLGMNAVRRAEESRGCRVVDVSVLKCGWDLTSHPPAGEGRTSEPRHIEVKGRVKGASTVTVTRNEILYALNQAEKFVLAIVLVGENEVVDGPHYIRNPFPDEPGWGVASVNYDLNKLLARAERQ